MSKEKTHEVKESKIKKLAKSCPEYDKAMRTLFPEAFEPKGFCCTLFEHGLYGGKGGHKQMIFDSSCGEYYNYPDAWGWKLKYCPSCGAKYDGKKWEARNNE